MTEGWTPAENLDPEAPAPDPERVVTEAPREPRKRSTRRPGQSTRKPAAGSRTRSKPRTPPARGPSTQEAIQGLLQMPAAGLIIAGQRAGSVALVADGATVLVHGPGLAAAIAELAENDPRVMALLERVLTFGPYGGLLAALFPMVAQLARNHGAPPEIAGALGAVAPEEIIAAGGLNVEIQTPAPSDNGQHGTQSAAEPSV